MKTQTNCFTDTANVHALKLTPDWRSDIFWSCVPNSCWSDYIAFQMRYKSPHAAVPGHFMNTTVTLAFEESTNHVHTNRDTYLSISVYIQLKGKHRVCFECELLPGSEDAAQENAPCSRSLAKHSGPGEPGSQPSSGPCLSRTPYTRLCCPWFNLYKSLSSECKGLSELITLIIPVPPPPPLKAYRLPYSRTRSCPGCTTWLDACAESYCFLIKASNSMSID